MPRQSKRYKTGRGVVRQPEVQYKNHTNDDPGVLTMDAFQNLLARTGYGSPSMMEATNYVLTRMTQDWNTLNALYRSNWLARRVIDIIPNDMLRQWISYQSDITPEDIAKLNKAERQTKIKKSILEGLTWGRLYGGAAGLMLIDGQNDLSTPLDLDSIMPGDFKGLLIVDRWQGIFPKLELVTDYNSPDYGLPELYEFRDQNSLSSTESTIVHHSRIVRFTGDKLPGWERQAENYWSASKIESLFEELKKRDNTSANIAGLVFLANLRVLKVNGLDTLLSVGNTKAQQDLYNTATAQNHLMNNFGMSIMDSEDDFQSFQYSFGGINDIYESFMLDMAGATEIPIPKLFGRNPSASGLGANGETDMRNYYEVIEREQEHHLQPVLDKLLPVLSMSALGYVPEDLEYIFNPIQTPSDKEMAETLRSESEVVLNVFDRGIISAKTVLKELKTMGEASGAFSNITDEDINAASDELERDDETLGIDEPTG